MWSKGVSFWAIKRFILSPSRALPHRWNLTGRFWKWRFTRCIYKPSCDIPHYTNCKETFEIFIQFPSCDRTRLGNVDKPLMSSRNTPERIFDTHISEFHAWFHRQTFPLHSAYLLEWYLKREWWSRSGFQIKPSNKEAAASLFCTWCV